MPLTAHFHECSHRCNGRVVAEDGAQDAEEDALAGAAGAVEEEQRMLDRDAGEAIASHALQVGLQLQIVAGDVGKEVEPSRAPRGVAVARRVMVSTRSCRRSCPRRRFSTSPGVLSTQGLLSQSFSKAVGRAVGKWI